MLDLCLLYALQQRWTTALAELTATGWATAVEHQRELADPLDTLVVAPEDYESAS